MLKAVLSVCLSVCRIRDPRLNGGAENAGLENACRSLKSMESEDFKNVFLTVLTERIVWKQTRTLLLHKVG